MDPINEAYDSIINEALRTKPITLNLFTVIDKDGYVDDGTNIPVLSEDKKKLSKEIDDGETVIPVKVTITPK
jgi:hypothetical protein